MNKIKNLDQVFKLIRATEMIEQYIKILASQCIKEEDCKKRENELIEITNRILEKITNI